MRRADRLFQLVQILRRSRVITAAALARELEVSERTVYRDIADLVGNGVPVEGEAGVGYLLPASFDLPPLMFQREELEALVLGVRMVTTWADRGLAASAKSALLKIEQVLPEALRARIAASAIFAPDALGARQQHEALAPVRQAIDQARILHFDYTSEAGERSSRRVRPLALFFWGRTWTLAAWCELRRDFRSFRIDRLGAPAVLDEHFELDPARGLDALLLSIERERQTAGGAGPAALRARGTEHTPKLPMSKAEARLLRQHGIRLRALAALGAKGLHQRLAGAMEYERCAELVSLADFQQLDSVGLETAQDLLLLGCRRIEDLVGREPVELHQELCERTNSRQDPCVEDALRCAIAQAEDPKLAPALGQWWRWTPLRGQPRGARP